MVIKIIGAFVLLSQISCTSPSDKHGVAVDTLAIKWVKDSIGCKQLRTKELATKLIDGNRLMHDTKERFLKVFQAPNETAQTKDEEVLKYYFNTMCEKGKLVPNSDKCYANFYFKSNNLVEMHFVCE